MVFSSLLFLFFYLPLVLFVYYVAPLRWRNPVLLVFNLMFYGWGEPLYIAVMIFSIVVDYVNGILIGYFRAKGSERGAKGSERGAKGALLSSIILNLGALFFFKYWDFIAGSLANLGLGFMPILNISLPIGISFYTFQSMSYTIDVYRGDTGVQRNIMTFGAFVTLFPQLIAGPILKYRDLADQLEGRTYKVEQFASGIQIFVVGLGKKVLLANNLGMLWDAYKAMPVSELTILGAWLGVIGFSLQIYFDFSGYSDMAVGLGRMLGFEFMQNFHYPYISRSVTEFWRRWHISLGSWFREYVYIPLGGNRVGRGRLCFNLMVVWGLTGIWHGASWNFLLWGLYFGLLLMLEKLFLSRWLAKLPLPVQHLYALVLVVVSWAIFALEDFTHLGPYLAAMFGAAGGGLMDGPFLYYLRSYLPALLIACLASTPLAAGLWKKLPEKGIKVVLPLLLLAGLVLSTAYLVDATYNPFLYFRF